MELSRDSMYFLGMDRATLEELRRTNTGVYEKFFKPPYLDELTIEKNNRIREIVLFKEPDIPRVTARHREREEDYIRAVRLEMYRDGVPIGTIRIIKQTNLIEELE